MSQTQDQASIDAKNAEFWNELCGTQLASSLGITDFSAASLAKFDHYYYDLYPYLDGYLPLSGIAGKAVLEIGLGYGTVAERLAAAGAVYSGLDIAAGPVGMVNHRMALKGLNGSARQGSILAAPFADASFDHVVTIGCIHHTGNIQQALDEIHRVLKPGGTAVVMVYNAYSYRRWTANFGETLRYWLWDYFGLGAPAQADESARGAYDKSANGAAPETLFVSPRHFRRLAAKFASVDVRKENSWTEGPLRFLSRKLALATVGRWAGLDIYCTVRK